jgi:hypothetical protein
MEAAYEDGIGIGANSAPFPACASLPLYCVAEIKIRFGNFSTFSPHQLSSL